MRHTALGQILFGTHSYMKMKIAGKIFFTHGHKLSHFSDSQIAFHMIRDKVYQGMQALVRYRVGRGVEW